MRIFSNVRILLVCSPYPVFPSVKLFLNISDPSFPTPFSHLRQYIYFLFAPTLIYRDQYPQSSVIQWNVVGKMFGQFLIVVFLVYYIIAHFWMPIFLRFFTDDPMTVEFAISTIFELMLPGVLIVILGKGKSNCFTFAMEFGFE